MKNISLLLFCAILLLAACTSQSLEKASNSYKKNRDYSSLKTLYNQLQKGMKKAEVEKLLGEPEYSPTEGQYYYSSDHRETIKADENEERDVIVGVVLEYRDGNSKLTDELQAFSIGPIGE